MTVVQITDTRIGVEPELTTQEFQFGPLPTVAANAVLLTRENLRAAGAYPPVNGHDWDCHLWVYWTTDGVETLRDISAWSVAARYWDPVSRSSESLTIAHGAALGQLTVSFSSAFSISPGMFNFAVWATSGDDTFDVCNGHLEVLPTIPGS